MVLRSVFLMGADGASVCRRASVAGVEAPYVSAGAVFASSPMYDSRRKVLLYPETAEPLSVGYGSPCGFTRKVSVKALFRERVLLPGYWH